MAEEEQQSPDEIIDDALQSLAPIVNAEGAVCTGWVLVSQWSGVDGSQAMAYQTSDNLTSWGQRGLLAEALNDLGR